MVAAKVQLFSSVIESRHILGLPLRPSALGRALSQLAGLLGPAALKRFGLALWAPAIHP